MIRILFKYRETHAMTNVYCVWERPATNETINTANSTSQNNSVDQIVMPLLFGSKFSAIKYLNGLIVDQNEGLDQTDPARMYHVFTAAELKLRLKFWKKQTMIGCVAKSKDAHLSIWMCILKLY